ncbi:hypothetical protein EXW72_08550 [Pseudomonas sp. BCA14]|uniref:hypothetical protein n=1 Tax=unclassified Pseudomonas TaxID=196821 RepID=UPI00106EF374|nr:MULTISPECIES: hypothetical protein [unclassified Pseudomonas]TFF13686.1 hypothetical protein EXW70_03940 [Pseudomonas sp. JMN1]TFF15631.1 hypothetical protein EXW71_05100 [Pseudomonas sp. BCA17]TFF32038.1 hypothetical protein EXW72_08550 [Pseudomonas sp. BCA14]TFF32991.1 hypothetical protein EXW73_04350 [Pseudomonas sp. BCA13]
MSNQWKLVPAAWLDPDSIQRGEILSAQAKKNSDFLGQQDRAARFSVPLYEHPDAAEVARLNAERDALQVLLTAADERADLLSDLLLRTLAYYTESCFPEDLLLEVKSALKVIP